ncbi:amidohydrolase family protein [Gloeobacter kilaueensis]|uniref:Amidohydrolase n=1 Tax=Gloeobacter kilaueensis (strain ATCC BAA-2537 / CCAP 1431/1 / ULC 316 / JS1) TaxID=1183438 RepID=U5QMF1_GLOK1|nr:amidohydrolase family protein [Gloeobacter kilaueensis]AGY60177.1 amidohydrolase [Gloeobacter kilaueensis JS1]
MRQNDRVDLCVENVRLIAAPTSVTIAGGVFAHIGSPPPRTGIYIDGGGCWLLPGLVNAHDHLGLDLLPRLGAPPYPNSIAWGEAVYRPRDSPLREVLGLSYSERLFWGAYRNLLAGVTTVQHHDRSHWCLGRLPVRVPAYRWLHRPAGSLGGSYGRGGPLFVHCAEGIDTASFTEVQALQARGLLGPASVLIHGIAIGDADIDLLARTGTAVVCCPTSNLFLFGRTAPIEKLQQAGVPLALGTDSTASGSLNLLEELRAASALVEAAPLVGMVTADAARILGVPQLGRIAPAAPGDCILIDNPQARTAEEALLNARPEQLRLVLVGGVPRLVREPFMALRGRLQAIAVDGEPTWLAGPIGLLLRRLRSRLGDGPYFGRRLAPLGRL